MSPPPLSELDDAALLDHCRRGGQAAWAVLVRRYQRLIYTIPRRAGLGEDAAADVFQLTYQRLLENIDRLADASRLRAWLVTTAKRETLRLIEQQRRIVEPSPRGDGDDETDPLEQIADPDPLPENLLETLQQHHRLRAAVDRLDERSRQLVELLFLSDEPLPYQEIARRLGIPEGSIGPTRARCLAKLRALLEAALSP